MEIAEILELKRGFSVGPLRVLRDLGGESLLFGCLAPCFHSSVGNSVLLLFKAKIESVHTTANMAEKKR